MKFAIAVQRTTKKSFQIEQCSKRPRTLATPRTQLLTPGRRVVIGTDKIPRLRSSVQLAVGRRA